MGVGFYKIDIIYSYEYGGLCIELKFVFFIIPFRLNIGLEIISNKFQETNPVLFWKTI